MFKYLIKDISLFNIENVKLINDSMYWMYIEKTNRDINIKKMYLLT